MVGQYIKGNSKENGSALRHALTRQDGGKLNKKWPVDVNYPKREQFSGQQQDTKAWK